MVSVLEFGADKTGKQDTAPAFTAAFATGVKEVWVPPGTYRLDSSITVPTFASLVGAGAQASVLNYSGSSFAVIATGNQGTRIESLKIVVTGGAGTEGGIKLTNTTAGCQYNRVTDCLIIQNNATPRIAGQKGIFLSDENGAGASMYWNLIENNRLLNWDIAIHLKKNGGTNGANQNYLANNFVASSLQHVLFDGACNDNTITGQMGSHSSVSVFTDVVLTIGDGATATGGNICTGIISDMGANGSAFNLTAASTFNFVVATNESTGADVDSGTNNTCFVTTKNISGLSQRISIPSLRIIGSLVMAGAFLSSGAQQWTKRRAVADTSPTLTSADFLVAYTSISAARTVTLPSAAATGLQLLIKDESGSASGANTITAAGAGGNTIDGAATLVVVNSAYGSKRIYSNGTNWFTE